MIPIPQVWNHQRRIAPSLGTVRQNTTTPPVAKPNFTAATAAPNPNFATTVGIIAQNTTIPPAPFPTTAPALPTQDPLAYPPPRIPEHVGTHYQIHTLNDQPTPYYVPASKAHLFPTATYQRTDTDPWPPKGPAMSSEEKVLQMMRSVVEEEREGKVREGKGREGKVREGKAREGKVREEAGREEPKSEPPKGLSGVQRRRWMLLCEALWVDDALDPDHSRVRKELQKLQRLAELRERRGS